MNLGEWLKGSTAASGVSLKVEDRHVLRAVAALVRLWRDSTEFVSRTNRGGS